MLSAIRAIILSAILCTLLSNAYAQSACVSATSVSSGATCSYSTYSLQGATAAQSTAASCTGASTIRGNWYKWVVGSTGPKFTFRNIGTSLTSSLYIEVFSGIDCNNLKSIFCQQLSGSNPTVQPTFAYEDVGLTYYFRVFTTSTPPGGSGNSAWSYDLCITDAPINDNCAGAISLTCATTCATITGSVYNATFSGVASGCGSTPTYDVWYQFNADATTETITLGSVGSAISGAQMELFSGTCGSLVSKACATVASGTATINASGLTPRTTYYVRVFATSGTAPTSNTNATFTLCVTDPAAPTCSSASTVASASSCTYTTYYLQGATVPQQYAATCSGYSALYASWYKFTVGSTGPKFSFRNIGSSLTGSLYIEIFSGTSCSPPGSPTSIYCQQLSGTNPVVQPPFTYSDFGKIYYFRIFTTSKPPGGTNTAAWGFDMCITDAQINDFSSGALPLATSTGTTCATTTGSMYLATNSGVTTNSGTTPTFDTWFSFNANTTNPVVTLNSIGTGLSTNNLRMEVYSGTPSSLNSLAYTTAAGVGSINTSALTIGSTYYVRVFATAGTAPTTNGTPANNNVTICVKDAAAATNDACANAITLTSGVKTRGNMTNTASTGNTNGCAGTTIADVWFKFVAQSTSPTIVVDNLGSTLAGDKPNVELLSGSCGSTTLAFCGATAGSPALAASVTASGLTVNQTYYVHVYTLSGSVPTSNGNFDILVSDPSNTAASRTNEVFYEQTLSGSNILNDPWEVTYGADGNLWVTESKGYKVYTMDPNTGAKTTVLDISQGAAFAGLTSAEQTTYDVQFAPNASNQVAACSCWPQGGLAGLALHPNFPTTPWVYISYVHHYVSTAASNGGVFFKNYLVRFTYNTTTKQLTSPKLICDTLPGSSDHNSQRLIAAPLNGTYYLFYAQGDMGAGQFGNANRPENAQNLDDYEGKILRFNLDVDGDAGTYDQWIPNTNPYNSVLSKQSAVWAVGIRNNQGFAYQNVNGTDILYGASHGPYSDDEVNILGSANNYGHPLVVGYTDGNYNGYTVGYNGSTQPVIADEYANARRMMNYKDPIFSGYDAPNARTAQNWNQNNNGVWPSEAWSGMDIYTNSVIPHWKNSLLLGGLKWGRVIRLQLDPTGMNVTPTPYTTNSTLRPVDDTILFFGSTNRYRDLAIAPNGRDIFIIMDKSTTTSGPTALNPKVPGCAGCLQKYTFLGYNADGTGRSTIPSYFGVSTPSTTDLCVPLSTVTISATNHNNNLWVPFTGPDGNIVAEVNAHGHDLGAMTAYYNVHAGTLREDSYKRLFMNRSITLTPTTQPGAPVSVRLYLTQTELNGLIGAHNSAGVSTGVTGVGNLVVYKNSDVCGTPFTTTGITVTPTYAEAFDTAYVVQADINSFSTFYMTGQAMVTLPLHLMDFDGVMIKNQAYLHWTTTNEQNSAYFGIERSYDGGTFKVIGEVNASGNTTSQTKYSYIDADACNPSSPTVYYRLKMVDVNGNYTYSKVIQLQCDGSGLMVDVYPNPVHHALKVKVSLRAADNVQIQVVDIQGRTLYSQSRAVIAGTNEIELNTESWPAGIYTVKVASANSNMLVTKNVVKQ